MSYIVRVLSVINTSMYDEEETLDEIYFNNIDDATDKIDELLLEGNRVKLLKEIPFEIAVRVNE